MTPTQAADQRAADNRVAIVELVAISGYAHEHTPAEALTRLRTRLRQLVGENKRITGGTL